MSTLTCEGPAYRIVTPRLVVRCWEPTDVDAYIEAFTPSREHLKPWLPWAADQQVDYASVLKLMRRMRARFDSGEDFTYAIFDWDEKHALGGSGLHTRLGPQAREIGYWMRVEATGQGYVTEAAAALTRVAFEIDRVQRVEIHCDAANQRSAAVPRRLGYTLDSVLRQRSQNYLGEWHDLMVWSMLASDYPGSLPSQAQLAAYDAAGRRIM